jgi:hypothetical protein
MAQAIEQRWDERRTQRQRSIAPFADCTTAFACRNRLAGADQVWAHVAARGGHSGEWQGMPPGGKQWTNNGNEQMS